MVYFNLDMLFFTQLSLTTNAPGRVSGLEDLTNWSVAKLAQALATLVTQTHNTTQLSGESGLWTIISLSGASLEPQPDPVRIPGPLAA